MTIREAATLLGLHPNTVRNHVKAGRYRAEKVLTERGETWMIHRSSLTANTPTSDSQQLALKVPQEALQELAREIVREAVGDAERRGRTTTDIAEQDRVLDAIRDFWKMRYDLAKQLGVISGVPLVVLAALLGVFYPSPAYPSLAYTAAVLLLFAAGGALAGMMLATAVVGELAEAEEDALLTRGGEPKYPLPDESIARAATRFRRWRLVPVVALIGGVASLLGFVALNL